MKLTALTLIAALITVAGAWSAARVGALGKNAMARLLAYSSGIMISVAFLGIFPEAWQLAPEPAAAGCLAALFALFLLENFAAHSSCSEYVGDCHVHSMGTLALLAMGLHSLLDGFNMAAGFSAGQAAGLNASLGVILHKLADGVALASLLAHEGASPRRIIAMSALLAAATPLGAFAVSTALSGMSPAGLSFALGASGGSLIYIAMADILPRLHTACDRLTAVFFPLGYATVIIIHLLAGH